MNHEAWVDREQMIDLAGGYVHTYPDPRRDRLLDDLDAAGVNTMVAPVDAVNSTKQR